MIEPPCACISRNADWFLYMVPFISTSKTAAQSRSVMSSAAPEHSIPATWASTSSRPPNVLAIVPNASSTEARLPTSQCRNHAVPGPAAWAAGAAALPSAVLTSSAATSAPAATYARSVAAPMPCAAPVTMIRIPARAPGATEPSALPPSPSGIGGLLSRARNCLQKHIIISIERVQGEGPIGQRRQAPPPQDGALPRLGRRELHERKSAVRERWTLVVNALLGLPLAPSLTPAHSPRAPPDLPL